MEKITIELEHHEVKAILATLKSEICCDIDFLQKNSYTPDNEAFITFLSCIQDLTNLYIKLSSAIDDDKGGTE